MLEYCYVSIPSSIGKVS